MPSFILFSQSHSLHSAQQYNFVLLESLFISGSNVSFYVTLIGLFLRCVGWHKTYFLTMARPIL